MSRSVARARQRPLRQRDTLTRFPRALAPQNFPKTEKYVSLFSRGGDEAHAQAERARLRALIKARFVASSRFALLVASRSRSPRRRRTSRQLRCWPTRTRVRAAKPMLLLCAALC